jgi:hypothetical protein
MIYLAAISTITFIVAVYLTFRCKHAWTVATDKEFPAPIQTLMATIKSWSCYNDERMERMSKKTYIAVMKCDKCGGLKLFKESA